MSRLDKIKARAAENVAYRVTADDLFPADIESPIERTFLTALRAEIEYGEHTHTKVAVFDRGVTPSDEGYGRGATASTTNWLVDQYSNEYPLTVQRQIFILDWPVDFLISSGLGQYRRRARLVVECDGHNFHERSKEQAMRDRSRDRALQEAGYTVFRFTGAELWRDPCACADQVIKWAETAGEEI